MQSQMVLKTKIQSTTHNLHKGDNGVELPTPNKSQYMASYSMDPFLRLIVSMILTAHQMLHSLLHFSVHSCMLTLSIIGVGHLAHIYIYIIYIHTHEISCYNALELECSSFRSHGLGGVLHKCSHKCKFEILQMWRLCWCERGRNLGGPFLKRMRVVQCSGLFQGI